MRLKRFVLFVLILVFNWTIRIIHEDESIELTFDPNNISEVESERKIKIKDGHVHICKDTVVKEIDLKTNYMDQISVSQANSILKAFLLVISSIEKSEIQLRKLLNPIFIQWFLKCITQFNQLDSKKNMNTNIEHVNGELNLKGLKITLNKKELNLYFSDKEDSQNLSFSTKSNLSNKVEMDTKSFFGILEVVLNEILTTQKLHKLNLTEQNILKLNLDIIKMTLSLETKYLGIDLKEYMKEEHSEEVKKTLIVNLIKNYLKFKEERYVFCDFKAANTIVGDGYSISFIDYAPGYFLGGKKRNFICDEMSLNQSHPLIFKYNQKTKWPKGTFSLENNKLAILTTLQDDYGLIVTLEEILGKFNVEKGKKFSEDFFSENSIFSNFDLYTDLPAMRNRIREMKEIVLAYPSPIKIIL